MAEAVHDERFAEDALLVAVLEAAEAGGGERLVKVLRMGVGMGSSVRGGGGDEDDFLVCPDACEAAFAGAALHVTASRCGGLVAFDGELKGCHCCFDMKRASFRLSSQTLLGIAKSLYFVVNYRLPGRR